MAMAQPRTRSRRPRRREAVSGLSVQIGFSIAMMSSTVTSSIGFLPIFGLA
jgi:hypothetical protein